MRTLLIVILSIVLFSCEKEGEQGPAGPQGPAGAQGVAGPQGPQGVAGNANVMQYTFPAFNFSTNGFAQLQVSTTKDTMDQSAWFVYMHYQPIDRWYIIPGHGPGGSTQYRISMGHSSNKVNLYIDKVGPGESFDLIRVIRVYANTTQTGGRMASKPQLPDIDFSIYEAVRTYYGLPD
jgi:hypothetical protein